MSFEYAHTLYEAASDAALASVIDWMTATGSGTAAAALSDLAGMTPAEIADEMRQNGWTVPYLEDANASLQDIVAAALEELRDRARQDMEAMDLDGVRAWIGNAFLGDLTAADDAQIRSEAEKIRADMERNHGYTANIDDIIAAVTEAIPFPYPHLKQEQLNAIAMHMDEQIREQLTSAWNWVTPGQFLAAYLQRDPSFPIHQFSTGGE